MKMPFGQYFDEDLSEIPTDYLRWILKECKDIEDELYEAIDEELEGRHEGCGK